MARLLLAEDDDSMRNFLSQALGKAGHDVDAVPDGVAAWEHLQTFTYDLLLADIVMPGMDGIELARRAQDMLPHLKVMFITGFAAIALSRRAPTVRHAGVLSKPFHLRQLVDQVQSILATI